MTGDEIMERNVDAAGRKLWALYEGYLYRRVGDLAGAERTFFVLWNFHGSVCTDGLWSFIRQSGGDLVPLIREDLKAAGAIYYVPIVDAALDLIGADEVWQDNAKRAALLSNPPSKVEEGLTQLDKQFYDRLDDFVIAIFDYVSLHRGRFGQSDAFWQEEAPHDPR